MSIKFQVFAIALLVIIFIDFLRSKRLPIISTKTFFFFWGASLLNIGADLASNYTLTHMEYVSPWLNTLAHQLYLGSLTVVVFMLFLYVFFLSGAQKRMPRYVLMIFALPCVVSLCFTILFPSLIYYHVDAVGAYSYGPTVLTFYIVTAIYIVSTFVLLLRKHNAYNAEDSSNAELLPDFKRARASIIVGLCIWIIIALVQYLMPYWLVSAMGVALMVMYIYIRFENPREYEDAEIGTFSKRAFHIMVPEMFARKKDFYMVNFTIDNVDQIMKLMSYDQAKIVLRDAAEQIGFAMPKVNLYHSRSYTITAFIEDKKQLDSLASSSELWNFKCNTKTADGIFTPNYHLTIIECPKYAENAHELYDTLDYCLSQPSLRGNGKIYYINDEIIEKKNYRKAVLGILNKAIAEKGFNVVYQPIYSASKKHYSSAEALVRLKDTETVGFVSPEYFIPLAEEQGLIGAIGSIVFEKVCSTAAKYKLWELGMDYIEVNLSGVQSIDIGIVAELTRIMKQYGVHPGFFNLEITETASTDGGDMLKYNMEQFRRMGCHFSMDDFGTGYSNLAQMAKVHFELVKLDKSLIWPCFDENPEEPLIILDSVIQMILRLDVKIVAEGVETREQADLLISKGVEYLQGYYFSRPVPEEDFVKAVKEALVSDVMIK